MIPVAIAPDAIELTRGGVLSRISSGVARLKIDVAPTSSSRRIRSRSGGTGGHEFERLVLAGAPVTSVAPRRCFPEAYRATDRW